MCECDFVCPMTCLAPNDVPVMLVPYTFSFLDAPLCSTLVCTLVWCRLRGVASWDALPLDASSIINGNIQQGAQCSEAHSSSGSSTYAVCSVVRRRRQGVVASRRWGHESVDVRDRSDPSCGWRGNQRKPLSILRSRVIFSKSQP